MDPIPDLFVPAVLVLLMLVVGSELTVADFRRVADDPGTALWGTLAAVLLPPLAAAGLILAARPGPHVAAGLILLAACPSGALSNYYAYLARADLALSVTLTACSIVASLVTLPLVATVSLSLLVGGRGSVEVPAGRLLGPMALFIVLPVAAGMAARARRPELVRRLAAPLRRVSLAAILALIVVVAVEQGVSFHDASLQLAALVLALTLVSLALGLAVGRLVRAGAASRVTLAFELAARNVAIAVLLGVTAVGGPEFLVFGAVALLAQAPTLLVVAGICRRALQPASED